MKKKFFKIVTPLRIPGLYFIISRMVDQLEVNKMLANEHEPALCALAPVAFGLVALICLILDVILSVSLKTKVNWLVQSIILTGFIVWIYVEI